MNCRHCGWPDVDQELACPRCDRIVDGDSDGSRAMQIEHDSVRRCETCRRNIDRTGDCPHCHRRADSGSMLEEPSPISLRDEEMFDNRPIETIQECRLPRRRVLRVMSWNIERLGGTPKWGLTTYRNDVVIEAIARVIYVADADLCAIIEVMSYAGRTELERIKTKLNSFDRQRQWHFVLPVPYGACTGKEEGDTNSGETYAVFYKLNAGIEPHIARFATIATPAGARPFPVGSYEKTDKTTGRTSRIEFRKPAEFIFTMSGDFAPDGTPWQLPLILFHAPSPQPTEERQREINTYVERLGLVTSARNADRYPDCIICADLNSSEDAMEIIHEPAEHSYVGSTYGSWDEMLCSWERLIDESTHPLSGRDRNKLLTTALNEMAGRMTADEMQRLDELVRQRGLQGHQHRPRSRVETEWRKHNLAILDEAATLELEADRLASNRSDARGVDHLVADARAPALRKLEELDPALQGLYVEDVRAVIDYLGRPGTLRRELLADTKRDLRTGTRVARIDGVLSGRERAWATLDEDGFLEAVTIDTDLLTTRRRAVSALRSPGKQGTFSLPEDYDDLMASNYDQILVRSSGRLADAEVCLLPILLATLPREEIKRFLQRRGDDLRQHGSHSSPLASFNRQDLEALVTDLLEQVDGNGSITRKATDVVAKYVRDKNLRNDQESDFLTLQRALLLARMVSDHDPLLAGMWIGERGEPPETCHGRRSTSRSTVCTSTTRASLRWTTGIGWSMT